MLADLYIAKSVIGSRRMDLHRHATFYCAVRRLGSRLRSLFVKD